MVSSYLIWVAIAVVVVGSAAGWWWRRHRRAERREEKVVANSDYIFTLPSFRKRLGLARIAAAGVATLVGITAIAAALLAGRPVDRFTEDESMAARDIVLCLDVSGSMTMFDAQVLRTYASLIPSFQGERIALNIWSGATRVVFPLTDDYAMVEDELNRGAELMEADPYSMSSTSMDDLTDWIGGAESGDGNSSLIGDGLANCALAFDLTDETRSRTIIFATDNEVSGNAIFTLPEAAAFAEERGITVHAIYASDYGNAYARAEYEQEITSRGGLFYELDDPAAADAIVADIQAQQAIELDSDPKVVEIDRPDRYYGWLVAGVALLIFGAWGLRP